MSREKRIQRWRQFFQDIHYDMTELEEAMRIYSISTDYKTKCIKTATHAIFQPIGDSRFRLFLVDVFLKEVTQL